MERPKIAQILKRHHGSKSEVARRSGVKGNVVSMWLSGGSNRNVAAHAERYARELLDAEKAASPDLNGPSVRSRLPELKSGHMEDRR